MRKFAALAFTILAACGGGSRPDDHPAIPEGIPVIVGGFVNWTDVQTTPDSTLGIVNGTGNAIVSVTFTDASGDDSFSVYIAPGAVWSSGADFLPGFYLVRATGLDGRTFARYFSFDPSIGSEAAVISNFNWSLDF